MSDYVTVYLTAGATLARSGINLFRPKAEKSVYGVFLDDVVPRRTTK